MGDDHGRLFQDRSRYDRDKMEPHFLDWDHQPSVYKDYPDAPVVELLAPSFPGPVDMQSVISRRRSVRTFSKKPVTIQQLSTMLWASAGITMLTSGFAYRAAPSAGALYPVETYVVANNVADLEPGLYHYQVKSAVLHKSHCE